jgi:CheY-like chemotaxis protein
MPTAGRTRALVLTVHGDPIARYLWCRYLRQAGLDALEATCGAEAIELAARDRPALAVVDVELPDMSGYSLGRTLWREPATSSTRLLYVSRARAPAALRLESLAAGGDAAMALPLERDEFLTTVAMLLGSPRRSPAVGRDAWSWQSLSSGVDDVMSSGPLK